MAQVRTAQEVLESDPFYSPDTNLDLSAFPWLRPLADAPVDDGKFAPVDTRGMGAGSSALKKFLSNPDREAVREMKDPELLKKYDEGHTGSIVRANGIPFRVIEREGKWHAKGTTPDGVVHRFTASSRDALFPKITDAVRENTVTVRELSDAELLQVIRYVQAGDTQMALSQYLWLATNKKEIETPFEILDDPRYRELCDQAVLFVWQHARTDYSPSPEREKYMDEYVARRPLSLPLLDSAWKACQQAEKDYTRSALLGQLDDQAETMSEPREVAAQINELDDESVDQLMAATRREYAREVRASRR